MFHGTHYGKLLRTHLSLRVQENLTDIDINCNNYTYPMDLEACPKMDWLRLSSELSDRSVSRLTRCDVVCPITPFENNGGISIDNDDPMLKDSMR
jgi:hypothetical protein